MGSRMGCRLSGDERGGRFERSLLFCAGTRCWIIAVRSNDGYRLGMVWRVTRYNGGEGTYAKVQEGLYSSSTGGSTIEGGGKEPADDVSEARGERTTLRTIRLPEAHADVCSLSSAAARDDQPRSQQPSPEQDATTHNPHLSAPLFSSVSKTHLSSSSSSSSSFLQSAISLAALGSVTGSGSSSPPSSGRERVRASRRVVRRRLSVVEEVTGRRTVPVELGLSRGGGTRGRTDCGRT